MTTIYQLKREIDLLLSNSKLRQCGKTETMRASLEWKFDNILGRIVAEQLMDTYQMEINRRDEGGELIDDIEFQKALKTVFDYFATDKEKEEFNLTYQKQ